MATGGNMSLSDDLIEKLSEAIVVTKMETIAISYLKVQSETVANLRVAHQGNPTGFNRAVLTIWKCMNPGNNQVQDLAGILYKAASDSGYADPHKVQEILGVTNTNCVAADDISEAEFLSLAEKLKPFAEEKMKIEPFPWFEGYFIDMDELYTELTLEKVERKLSRQERRKLREYKEMFNCHKSEHKNRKVLMKADPGMGKTTLGKKMTWDWGKGVFNKFSIVFFVALKLVNPGDPIENVIIQQNPELEGLHVSKEKLRSILKIFSSKVLIILDGLDEHGLGQNEDVLKMIKNQKLVDCPILISSRPHGTWEIEYDFPTVVKVNGFTEEEAKKFVSNFFTDESRIKQIMKFQPSDSRECFPVHKCPILLSILCFLVTRQEVDLSDTNITIGDLYFTMVKCLYKKYTIKKGVPFQESELIQVMKSVGKLALYTLLSNNPLLERNEVVRIAGEFALDYGFLAGDKNFTDLTADIYVTYAHRSLEEFFGSFGFLQALQEGQSIDAILGSDCEKPIFLVNPLVLRFCLWFQTEKCFNFSRNIYQKLVFCAAKRIDSPILHLEPVAQMYPAMNISGILLSKDSLKLKFFKDILETCQHAHVLHIGHYFSSHDEVHEVLELINGNLLRKLTWLSFGDDYPIPTGHHNNLAISTHFIFPDIFRKFLHISLPKYHLLMKNPEVYAKIQHPESHDLSTLITKHIKQLELVKTDPFSEGSLFASGNFPSSPQFTHFTAHGYVIDNSVPQAFLKAVQDGNLPNLKRIELRYCTISDCEWPAVPEFSLETEVRVSTPQKLLSKLTELILHESFHIDHYAPVCSENLSVLKLKYIVSQNLPHLENTLAEGKLPNLSELLIDASATAYRIKLYAFLDEFEPHKTVKLIKLALQWFVMSVEELEILSQKLTTLHLSKLDVSKSFGLTDNLSALFTHSLPTLNTLILRGCKLNTNDLQSLGQAHVQSKLPQLKHLDISLNDNIKISDLFAYSDLCNQLTNFAVSDENVLNVEPQFLTSLEELWLWFERPLQRHALSIKRRWPCLMVIEVTEYCIVDWIADAVERGMFPSLTTVRGKVLRIRSPILFKLHKANISVEEV